LYPGGWDDLAAVMAANHMTDAVLMREAALGDRVCLGKLVRRYAGGLLTFITGMVGDRHRSEELFQEVVLTVWKKRRQYRYPRPFKPWLYKIALNRCRLEFRRPAPVTADLPVDGIAASPEPTPVEVAIAAETETVVKSAVAQLADRQRVVVVLRIWNDLSYGEIAEILGVTEGTVRSYMFHALNTMRRYLEPRLR
jgi:RNA polymerase sigma-70 factor (ECF subfamily)